MARADTRTLLPLDRFANLCQIHPLLFNQVTTDFMAVQAQQSQSNSACFSPFLQWAWQNADRVGREEIAQAIQTAEEHLARYLRFPVAPTWIRAERHVFPLPANPSLPTAVFTPRYDWMTLQLDQGYIISGGVEAFSVVSAGAAIVYSDTDLDGYKETATITVATSLTDPAEIALFYPSVNADTAWEIRPITVTISGGNATIVCRREQLVLAAKLTSLTPQSIDGLVDSNFLTTVDVYRRYNDPSQQVEFLWYNEPCQESAGVYVTQTGILQVRDSRLGLVAVQPATWDGTSAWDAVPFAECRPPDALRFWYHAGYPSGTLTYLDPMWERAVTYYALALLDRPLCGCKGIEAQLQRWREDLAMRRTGRAESASYALPSGALQNPFGTYRGALYAWERVKDFSVPIGVSGR